MMKYDNGEHCPQCGEETLHYNQGIIKCSECGWCHFEKEVKIMKLYTLGYKKQKLIEDNWVDTYDAIYNLYTVAESLEEATIKFNNSLEKLNKHAGNYFRYLPNGTPKEIEAISVCEDIHKTIVTGIWE